MPPVLKADARLAFGRSARLGRLWVVVNHRVLPSAPMKLTGTESQCGLSPPAQGTELPVGPGEP